MVSVESIPPNVPTDADRREMEYETILALGERAIRQGLEGRVMMPLDLAKALVGLARRGVGPAARERR